MRFWWFSQEMNESPVKKFIIDGFPRNEDNLTGWRKRLDGKVDVICVLFLDCPENVSAGAHHY